jgi:hypothetical protein
MDNEIQSRKTHSQYTQSYQVAILVPFASFGYESFRLAYCWVHSHRKTTADLFQALHSIQFARIKKSFISARVLISTFDGLTLSSRMACWVCTLTVKVSILHQTKHAVPSKWWHEQQHSDCFASCWDLQCVSRLVENVGVVSGISPSKTTDMPTCRATCRHVGADMSATSSLVGSSDAVSMSCRHDDYPTCLHMLAKKLLIVLRYYATKTHHPSHITIIPSAWGVSPITLQATSSKNAS